MVGQKVTGWIEGLAVALFFFARAFGVLGLVLGVLCMVREGLCMVDV
jgi:hypothetical protein